MRGVFEAGEKGLGFGGDGGYLLVAGRAVGRRGEVEGEARL